MSHFLLIKQAIGEGMRKQNYKAAAAQGRAQEYNEPQSVSSAITVECVNKSQELPQTDLMRVSAPVRPEVLQQCVLKCSQIFIKLYFNWGD